MISLECEPWLWNAIVQHLKTKTGLSCDGLGSLNIRRTIAYRMKLTQTRSVANYWFQLQQQGAEWQAFLDEVVVPETSFFRDRVPFMLLAEWAKDYCLKPRAEPPPAPNSGGSEKGQPLRKLRILSLPCSTGEEPYSIALALLASGLTLDQFEIDAIDLSDRALMVAKCGRYETKPIGSVWERTSQYWDYADQSLQISSQVQRSIHFKLGNIMDLVLQNIHSSDSSYDVIFCRNLLIYFDSQTRQQVLQAFDRLLEKSGLLFVGHAETGSLLRDCWSMFPFPYAFAYQKIKHPTPKINKSVSKQVSRQSKRSALPKDSAVVASLLKRSRELADAAQLEEALDCCEKYLKIQPLCGEGHFLMGQICQAIGSLAESDRYLAKAIYLMPDHEDALMQLALLRESQGDLAGARALKRRMLRSRA